MRQNKFVGVVIAMMAAFWLVPRLQAESKVEISTATGKKITFDGGTGIATIEGDAVVETSTATLKADNIRVHTKEKKGRAEGNVRVEQASSTITGDAADYYWEAGTGTIHGAAGVSPPWRFSADEMDQITPELFSLDNASVTSCDEVPPHYRVRSRRGKIRKGKRMKLYNARLVPGDTPSFWLPFYTRSLVPKKYRLRIEPGQSSRDGFKNRTIFGYPFTNNSWTNIRWDYLQHTGNGIGLEHRYDAPNVKGNFDSYYIKDINPDPAPRSREYTIFWNHYQRLTEQLTLNSKLDLKSRQSFGNNFTKVGNGTYVESTTRGLVSQGGFTYQFPWSTLQAQFARQDKFDTLVSSHQFISQLTLPQLFFNTAPLKPKVIPFYTTFSGSYLNGTQARSTPKQNLYYTKTGNAAVEIKRDIRFSTGSWTFTPIGVYSQNWNNRVVSSTGVITEEDLYVGRYTLGMDGRRRYFRRLDLRLAYRYTARNRTNQSRQDNLEDDYGVEANILNGSFQTRIGRSTFFTVSSGYDYRKEPRSSPDKYRHTSERVVPPSLDIQWEVKPDVNVFFRETYSIFDTRTRTPINTPLNTSGEIQFGKITGATFFSQGFAYSKKSHGSQSEVVLTDKLKFYLSPRWYVDLLISFRAVGEKKLNYSKTFPIERTLRVVRDLHCWLLRAEFSQRRAGSNVTSEVSFYIDLKANLTPERNIFRDYSTSVYSSPYDGPPLEQIFPDPAATGDAGHSK